MCLELDEETLAMLTNHPAGWDCDRSKYRRECYRDERDMEEIDEEDSTGELQSIALDRFGCDSITARPWHMGR